MDRRVFIANGAALAAAPILPSAVGAVEPELSILARVGPWPVTSRLIGYDGKVWFANSVKGRNHNSADIWSFDPETAELRYEHHLFSQDAGVPLVHRDLLYWPYEDGRYSFGWGCGEITNGEGWETFIIPTTQAFHTHSMTAWQNKFLAVTSAWRAGLQVSTDKGRNWENVYDHPTPAERLSRFHEPTVLADTLYGSLKDPSGIRMVRFTDDDEFEPVPGWPKNRTFFSLTVHKDLIYAIVLAEGNRREIWRTDGTTSQLVSDRLGQSLLMGMTSDGKRLWLLERLADGKAQVLSSAMGEDWQVESRLAGGKPSEISIINGAIYVAGAGDDGRGILWGPKQHTIPKLVERPIVPEQFLGSPEKGDVWDMAQDFDAILSDIQNYRDHGRGPIRDILLAALELGTPNGFYAGRLKAVLKEGTVSAFGGQLEISARGLGRNILLWGMGLAKQDDVPLEDLRAPWVKKSNTFEKYIDAQPIAIWAAANAHQNDRPTIDELVKRLDAKDDPLWLRSQIIGALTRLTGQHFAYDVDAWQNWWNSARMKWQK